MIKRIVKSLYDEVPSLLASGQRLAKSLGGRLVNSYLSAGAVCAFVYLLCVGAQAGELRLADLASPLDFGGRCGGFHTEYYITTTDRFGKTAKIVFSGLDTKPQGNVQLSQTRLTVSTIEWVSRETFS